MEKIMIQYDQEWGKKELPGIIISYCTVVSVRPKPWQNLRSDRSMENGNRSLSSNGKSAATSLPHMELVCVWPPIRVRPCVAIARFE